MFGASPPYDSTGEVGEFKGFSGGDVERGEKLLDSLIIDALEVGDENVVKNDKNGDGGGGTSDMERETSPWPLEKADEAAEAATAARHTKTINPCF